MSIGAVDRSSSLGSWSLSIWSGSPTQQPNISNLDRGPFHFYETHVWSQAQLTLFKSIRLSLRNSAGKPETRSTQQASHDMWRKKDPPTTAERWIPTIRIYGRSTTTKHSNQACLHPFYFHSLPKRHNPTTINRVLYVSLYSIATPSPPSTQHFNIYTTILTRHSSLQRTSAIW